MLPYALLLSLLPLCVIAQDGAISGPTTSPSAAGYSCDPTKCKLPDCNCASTDPPGGLKPSDVPQFIVFTADDAVQSYTLDSVNQFIGQRVNPNGCPIKMTYFTSLSYTNYTLVTDWYVAGNEIADHTMTHVGTPSAQEINGNLIALNALAGIPLSDIKGFRAPFLNYSVDTLKLLAQSAFTYDSSAAASIPVTDPNTDAYWPYTLDNGMANNCLSVPGTCRGEPKLPGFWEIPMYAFFDERGVVGPHLMDPWLDAANGASTVNDTATLEYMKKTFTDHYNGKRQPIGLYTHPIHLSRTYPGVNAPMSTINMINAFLDWAQQQQNVWIVSNLQLLEWVRNPVPVSQLSNFAPLKCTTPQVDSSAQICNGIPKNENGLLSHCAFSDFPFYTCYGCPTEHPTPDQPNPPQDTSQGQPERHRLPANCSTPFWDPIAGKCLCTASTCTFTDLSRPIGPNGANLTGGGTGDAFNQPDSLPSYTPFSAGTPSALLAAGAWPALFISALGALVGLLGVMARL
ncbi:Chitin deacetylase 7 [Psilocybe cubensis]|uniref:Chitin deacetylase 7 n=2 Tax=Psilocybe cubensis TaxID=181762 RepID=A0ACB8HE75_PSICU|nr:Chitin deacetylase 7 [Psilocybe cubensis]KAH9486218.1 Chitin deacetylase 7 [Psilocybe cubensis]